MRRKLSPIKSVFQKYLWKLVFANIGDLKDEMQVRRFREKLRYVPFLPYEKFGGPSIKTMVAKADSILEQGWSRSNNPTIDLINQPIPWEESKAVNRSWSYFIHSWDMLNDLLMAYSFTKKERYLTPALNIGLDWVAQYPHPPAPSSFAWYDMAVGMRSYRLAYILDAAARLPSIEDDKIKKLYNSLIVHRKYLSHDSNISFHSNHGFFQIAGQLALARRFIFLPGMSESYKQANDRIKRIIAAQFSEEGVHREHSPDYHRLIYHTLLGIFDSGVIQDQQIRNQIIRIEKSLSWFIKPNNVIVNFGDSDPRTYVFKGTVRKEESKPRGIQKKSNIDKKDNCQQSNYIAFKKAGYFVVKKNNEDPSSINEQFYLAQLVCFHSRTHKHADDLTFVWFDLGRDILIDSGRYGYFGAVEPGSVLWKNGNWYSDPKRLYVESTRAHNTVEIDERDYQRKGRKPFGSAIENAGEQDGIFFSEAHVRHFSTMRHRRFLFFNPGQWLFVFDWLWDNKEKFHDYRQWFHFAPDIEVIREENQRQYRAIIPGISTPLLIASFFDEPDLSPVYKGATEPVFQGWWSPQEKVLEPNPTVAFEKKGVRNAVFGTLFIFTEELIPDVVLSQAHPLGRKADIYWQTQASNYRFTFKKLSEQEGIKLLYREKPKE